MRKLLALVLCSVVCASVSLFAQQPSVKWNVSMEPMKRFIENKSQFDDKDELPGSQVLFGVDHGNTQLYFTNTGMTFRLEKKKGKEPEHERIKEEKMKELGYVSNRKENNEEDKRDLVHLQWEGANPSATLIGLDAAEDYLSYNVGENAPLKNINFIKGYKRLLYKNLYPGIDVEYAFHPVGGIKYKIIVHPGADVSQVKMKYSGAEAVLLDEIGNVRLATVFGDIMDNAPLTFYEGNQKEIIPSHFVADGNTISFQLEKFNKRKTVIIDPWTITPTLPNVNKVYNIEADTSGNAYIFGGDSPYRLQKYNAAGVLQWTYNAPWSAANNWFGGMTVDPAGNSIITSGTDAQISKINTAGSLVWSNAGSGAFAEYWIPMFNCDYTQLLIGGTNLINVFAFQFNGAVYEVNINTGALIRTVNVAGTLVGAPGNPPFIANEVRSLCYSPNGNYYFLTLDTVGSLSPALTINYRDSSFHQLSYYLPYGQGGSGQGINGIAATGSLLYTTDGQTLYRRDINSGNALSSVIIPNGSKEINSGVAVDSCGNVYVGSVTKLHKYDANLNLLATVNTPAEVYDVAVSRSGEVLACGNGFALSVDMNSCDPQRPVCVVPFTATMSKTNTLCSGECNGTATATPTNGSAPFDYLWSNGQTTQTATNLCASTYAVTITDANNRVFIGSVNIEQPDPIVVDVTSFNSGCGTSAVATPDGGTPPFTYQWSNGETLASISDVVTGTYAVTVFDANNCSASGSVNVTQTSGFTLNDSVVKPACGVCNGTATVTPVGGNPPFTYIWSTGDTTQTATNLCAGAYSVTVTESQDTSGTIFWTEDFTTGGTGWTLNINGTGTNAANANSWVINNNLSACTQCPVAGSGGNYLHITCTSFPACISDAGSCIYDAGIPIFSNAATDKYVTSPNISTLGRTSITLSFGYMSDGEANDYGLVRLSDDGGTSWTDLPTKYFGIFTCTQASITIPAQYENIANFRIGFRWINDNNTNGSSPPFMIDDIELSSTGGTAPCTATALVNVSNDSSAVVTVVNKTDVSCNGSDDGAIDIDVTGGNPPYAYAWTGGDTLQDISSLEGGVYSVTVTDSVNCISLLSVEVVEPSLVIATASVTNAGCSPTGRIDLTVNGGVSPYTYEWSSGATSQDLNNVAAGTYSVTVTDNNSCERTDSFTVNAPGNINLALVIDDVTCQGVADGSVTANVTGANPPLQFTWSNGATTSSITSISGATYSVSVRDGNNCTASQTATVDEPVLLTATASITRVLCEGGDEGGIKLNPAGGVAPYTAEWSNDSTGLSLTDLAPGIYIATVTDVNGCTLDTAIDLSSVSNYVVDAVPTNSSCGGGADGSVFANILSNTTPPYSYTWNTGDTTATITNVAPGIYSVTVTDSLSCLQIDTAVVVEGSIVIEDSVINTSCPTSGDGSIAVTVSGGTAPYNYAWSNGGNTAFLQNVQTGNYSLTVTDVNNCVGNKTIEVLVDTSGTIECDQLVIYDVFSPNGDGVNDTWIIDGLQDYANNDLQIFNRWGNVVFEANPYDNTWDGESDKGELLPSATYYYILKLNDVNKSIYSGPITLIR